MIPPRVICIIDKPSLHSASGRQLRITISGRCMLLVSSRTFLNHRRRLTSLSLSRVLASAPSTRIFWPSHTLSLTYWLWSSWPDFQNVWTNEHSSPRSKPFGLYPVSSLSAFGPAHSRTHGAPMPWHSSCSPTPTATPFLSPGRQRTPTTSAPVLFPQLCTTWWCNSATSAPTSSTETTTSRFIIAVIHNWLWSMFWLLCCLSLPSSIMLRRIRYATASGMRWRRRNSMSISVIRRSRGRGG